MVGQASYNPDFNSPPYYPSVIGRRSPIPPFSEFPDTPLSLLDKHLTTPSAIITTILKNIIFFSENGFKNQVIPRSIGRVYFSMQPGNSNACFNKMFGDYKRSARRRNLPFELSEREFRELTQQPCWYCGSEPAHMYRTKDCKDFYLGNGIDRVDNDKGYIWENCVAACTICNRMKLTLSAELFISQIRRIMSNLGI